MFDELERYKEKNHFFFKADSRLSEVCNAPANCSGIYLIYALERDKVSLIYIGISGRKDTNGDIKHRKDGLRGRFLAGKQFGDKRQVTWPNRMKLEDIEALDIYWYVTHGKYDKVFPRDLEKKLLEKYRTIFGKLPRWNNKI